MAVGELFGMPLVGAVSATNFVPSDDVIVSVRDVAAVAHIRACIASAVLCVRSSGIERRGIPSRCSQLPHFLYRS